MKIIAISIVVVILAFHSTAGQETLEDVCKKLLDQTDFRFMKRCKERRTQEECVNRCVRKIERRGPGFLQERLDRMSERLKRIEGRIADREINCDNSERRICQRRNRIQSAQNALTNFIETIDSIEPTTTEGEVTESTATEGEVTESTATEGEVTESTATEGEVTESTATEGETTGVTAATEENTEPTGSGCPNPISENQDQINKMLEAHNLKRRLFNTGPVSAKNGIFPEAVTTIQDLIWNSELAKLAQAHSDKCVFEHSTGNSLAPFSNIGENVYMASKGVQIDPVCDCTEFTDWTAAVESWYSEIDDFASQDQICSVVNQFVFQQSPALGHFTQVIWADTTEVGCGAAFCMTSTKCSILITCNYGEAGNYGQQAIYTNGTCPPLQS